MAQMQGDPGGETPGPATTNTPEAKVVDRRAERERQHASARLDELLGVTRIKLGSPIDWIAVGMHLGVAERDRAGRPLGAVAP